MENIIFYIDDYKNYAQYANNNGYAIIELTPDENGRRFTLKEPQLSEKECAEIEIAELKQELAKFKEDVEQVELFGMQRADYEEKKSRCAEIILELRKLEKELADED